MSNQEKINLEKSLNDECLMLDEDIRNNMNDAETTKK